MTSKERVIAAVEFREPDRLPMNCPLLGRTDFFNVGWKQIGTGDHALLSTIDEWGCRWSRSEVKNMGLVTGHPLKNWDDFSAFTPPNPDDPKLYEDMAAQYANRGDKYVMTGIFMLLFERLHSLRGFENTMVDLYEEPLRLAELADMIVDYDVRVIRNIESRFHGQIDGFSFTDDWGTETAAFISTKMFDEFFAPRYNKIFDACRSAGWHIWMHSCGKVNELIPSLINIGVNVFDLQQPRALGIKEIGRRFAGKTAFLSLCDIQHTLPFKSDVEIEEEAKELLKYWATPEGGFILNDYGDGAAIGVSPAVKQVMLDAFDRHDPYSKGEGGI